MKCPICHNVYENNYLVAPALDTLNGTNYEYFHCINCDILFLVNESKSAQFIDHGNSGYYSRRDNQFQIFIKNLISLFHKFRVGFVKRVSGEKSIEGLNILDVGCGKGGFLEALKVEGAFIHGLEPTMRSFEIAEDRLGCCILNQIMSKEIFSESSMDVITMWHVFEHVSKPEVILEDCYHVLKKMGLLLLRFQIIEDGLQGSGGNYGLTWILQGMLYTIAKSL